MDRIDELLTRGVANVIPSREALAGVLRSDRKLNIYLGVDPTATRLHLGNATHLRRLQNLVELGHRVTFLIGDFTALVGDTSDKDSERPILSSEQIEANWQNYQSQAGKLVDFTRVKIRRNSEWLSSLTFADIIHLCQQYSLNDFISRELIKNRLSEGKSIRLDETLYPLMQGYDSYTMDTDLQIGGTDQTFNMQAGRHLQQKLKNKESYILAGEFLEGTDGRKMSKSWGNAVWLDDAPRDMYGKIMSVKDDLLRRYFELATNLPIDQIDQLFSGTPHPMELKKHLARRIVTELHSEAAADEAAQYFTHTVQAGELPSDIPEVSLNSLNLVDALVESGLSESKSSARRLIEQGGVEVDSVKITDPEYKLSPGVTLKAGKRRFVRLSPGQ